MDSDKIQDVADEFLQKILEIMPDLGYDLCVGLHQRWTWIKSKRRRLNSTYQESRVYSAHYNGLIIHGVYVTIDVVNDQVYEFKFHLPMLSELGKTYNVIRPEVALDKLLNDSTDTTQFFNRIGPDENSTRTITSFVPGYYYDFHMAKDGYDLVPVYIFEGTEYSTIFNDTFDYLEYIIS